MGREAVPLDNSVLLPYDVRSSQSRCSALPAGARWVVPEGRAEPAREGDYATRGCPAHLFTSLAVGAVGHASGHAFERLIHLVPRVSLGPVTVSTRLLKYLVATPALAILLLRVYRP